MRRAARALLGKRLTGAAGVLLGLGLLANESMTAKYVGLPGDPVTTVQTNSDSLEIPSAPQRAMSPAPLSGITRETEDGSEDSGDNDPRPPADLASEAGVTTAVAITCGYDPAPVRSAFESMVKSLKLNTGMEQEILQRYHSTVLSTEMTLARGQSPLCQDLGNILKSTIRDLSSPASESD
jgi:hypothetical protein